MAGCFADGVRYIDKRAGWIYFPLSVYRYLSAIARTFVRKGFLFIIGYRIIISYTFGYLVLGCLPAGRGAVCQFDVGREYRSRFPENVIFVTTKSYMGQNYNSDLGVDSLDFGAACFLVWTEMERNACAAGGRFGW